MTAMARALGDVSADRPEAFIAALARLKQSCGVDGLRLADYGFRPEDADWIADNAMQTMGGLFKVDPAPLSREDIVQIVQESCR